MGGRMKNISCEEFKNKRYIKNILKTVKNNLKDNVLTGDFVQALKNDEMFRIWGLQYQDVSFVDFSKLEKSDFDKLPFSSTTKFPDKMPKFFDKNAVLKIEKCNFTPDDSDVCMAVIDNPTQFYVHDFYKGKNIELVDFSAKNDETHFHMEGVLSNIFKYANNPKIIAYTISWKWRHKMVLLALKDVLQRIKNGQKIFVVSISNQLVYDKTDEQTKTEIKKIVDELKKLDCEVVDSFVFFKTLNCSAADKPMFEEEKLSNYRYTFNTPTKIGIPVSRVITEFGSKEGFAISGAGQSWAIPVVAYFYAYCKSKKESISLEEFAKICDQTSQKTQNCAKIADFSKLVKYIKNKL